MTTQDIVARLKHTLKLNAEGFSVCLYAVALIISAVFGFLLGKNNTNTQPDQTLVLASYSSATEPSGNYNVAAIGNPDSVLLSIEEMAQIRAEILRLRVLFARLAEQAKINTGEFDIDAEPLPWQQQSSKMEAELLNTQLAHISHQSGVLQRIFEERSIAYRHRISGLPVVNGRKSSGYGYRKDPFDGSYKEHLGLDFTAFPGSSIYALADGVVTFSGRNGSYGNLVELEHVDGYVTRYAHNDSNLVVVGENVEKGQVIATLGSTGKSTGPHVHVEVRLNGSPIDPTFFVR